MPSVILAEASLAFGERNILKSVNLNLSKSRKLALAGANGSGKSTLMRILIGELKPDLGTVVREKDTRISYLPQSGSGGSAGRSSSLSLDPGCSVHEHVEKVFAAGAEMERQLRDAEHELVAIGASAACRVGRSRSPCATTAAVGPTRPLEGAVVELGAGGEPN